ncbi:MULTISPECIES: S1C family serine protease [Bacillus]|uniref:Serine protease n=2 Tax=Bacillus TaxID=1386 RepID=A0A0M4FHQ8_9BACI|nr:MULTISPECIES: S1C family serine protease [Bacillus]ALC82311.1 serine protease [Bacillus gobiensis]MBP1081173.1 serine protease Do [Bacillus capparidis]MED1095855.1 S1C family serine protease [Bacillus capparidis]
MDYRREDQNQENNNQQNNNSNEQNQYNSKADEPNSYKQEEERRVVWNSDDTRDDSDKVDAPVISKQNSQPNQTIYEAGETAASVEESREKNNNKTKKRRAASWLSPILGGVIGGGLVLGVFPYLPNQQEENTPITENASSGQEQSPNFTKTSASKNNSDSIADMVEELSPSIVGISNIQNQQSSFGFENNSNKGVESGTGTGIVFKKDGDKAYIVTNNHVVEGANKVKVSLFDGSDTEAKLVGSDALTDLAVLEISSKGIDSVASFGNSSKARPGDQVIAIGNPLGHDFSRTVTEGIISGINRSVDVSTSQGSWEMNVLQTDAAINAGNSGGPLINSDGQVIGINSLKISETGVESIGFAIPSNDLQPIVDELLEKGNVERPFLGVSMLDMERVPQNYQEGTLGLFGDQLNKGAYIDDVQSGSAAQKAGIKSGDVIVGINGKSVTNTGDLKNILYKETKIGDKVTMDVLREGKKQTFSVTLSQKEEES